MKERYDSDRIGLYDKRFFEKTGLKARPLTACSQGEMVFDTPKLAAKREIWRQANYEDNKDYEHRTSTGLVGFKKLFYEKPAR